ncbi:hypothetical protein LWU32_00075 [Enterobacter hormaechei]|nr:hypothetical protein [Enterobacter hormaechei]
MSTITKEWLQSQISGIKAVGITDSNTLQAFEIALASLEAEPAHMFGIGSVFKPQILSVDEVDCDNCAHYQPNVCHGEGCPAAMLQGAEPVTTAYKLRDAVETIRNSGIAIDADKIFAERDALNSPVIPDGWVLVPIEPTPDMREAYHQAQAEYEDVDGLWSPDHQWQAMHAAAPEFREIVNSSTNNCRENAEMSTKCWCRTCRPVTISDMRFVVCPECGNKRCPHANDHRNACTGSNEPGQEGSAYPAAPKQEVK